MLVLDEATSELDLLTGVREFVGDIPVLLISHRQSTHRVVDRNVTLADGRLVDAAGAPESTQESDRSQ